MLCWKNDNFFFFLFLLCRTQLSLVQRHGGKKPLFKFCARVGLRRWALLIWVVPPALMPWGWFLRSWMASTPPRVCWSGRRRSWWCIWTTSSPMTSTTSLLHCHLSTENKGKKREVGLDPVLLQLSLAPSMEGFSLPRPSTLCTLLPASIGFLRYIYVHTHTIHY